MSWCSRRRVWRRRRSLRWRSSGCGYALAGRGNFLPAYIRTIGIPTFTNQTSFFEIAQIVTDKVRTEFIGRGNYKIVPEATGADAVLIGVITGHVDRPDQLSGRAAGVALHDHHDREHRAARRAEGHRALVAIPPSAIREEYDATSDVRNDPTGVRRSVGVLQSGIECRGARQQRVRAHHRERHSGSLLIAARLPG